MSRSRRQAIVLVAIGIILCSWCSLFSGIGGWILGYDLGRRQMSELLLPETGVLVTRVERGSPAEQSGIRRGDTIIAINGVRVDDVSALQHLLGTYRPGEHILLTYRHTTGEWVTPVVLAHFPGSGSPYLGIYYTARAEAPADI